MATVTCCDLCGSIDDVIDRESNDVAIIGNGDSVLVLVLDGSIDERRAVTPADVCTACKSAIDEAVDARVRIVADQRIAVAS